MLGFDFHQRSLSYLPSHSKRHNEKILIKRESEGRRLQQDSEVRKEGRHH
jgi:hypothetical protein